MNLMVHVLLHSNIMLVHICSSVHVNCGCNVCLKMRINCRNGLVEMLWQTLVFFSGIHLFYPNYIARIIFPPFPSYFKKAS